MNDNKQNTTTIEENTNNISVLGGSVLYSGNDMQVTDNNINTTDISKTDNGKKYNIQNLKPYNKTDRVLSKDEAKRRGSIGGKKSGEVRKARKTMKETILSMLSQELSPEKMEAMGIDTSTLNGDFTYQAAIIAAMLREASNGDTKAMQLLRDTIDEAPVSKQELYQEIITKEDTELMDNLKRSLIS